MAPPLQKVERWLGKAMKHNVAVDLRALATMRVALGVCMLSDVAARAGDAEALYSDLGPVTRAVQPRPPLLQLYFLSGDPMWTRALFLLTAAAALWLILGWRARIAAGVCWALMGSLGARNWLVGQGGDDLLRMMLFWCIFAPVSARWSLDARARPDPRHARQTQRARGASTLALYAQLMVLYFFTGTAKVRLDHWLAGEAIYNALSNEYFVTALGKALYPHWYLLKALTYLTLFLEIGAPILLILGPPRAWFRGAVAVAFIGLHAGIAATLNVGLFSYVSMACWLFTLPSELMDRLEVLARRVQLPGQPRRVLRAERPWVRKLVAGLFGYLVIATAVDDKLRDGPLKELALVPADWLDFKLRWRMFLGKHDEAGFLVIEGRRRDGNGVDLLRGGAPVDWTPPELMSAVFPNQRWRKYLVQLTSPNYAEDAQRYLAWECGRAPELAEVAFVFVKHRIGARYDHGPAEPARVHTRRCDASGLQL